MDVKKTIKNSICILIAIVSIFFLVIGTIYIFILLYQHLIGIKGAMSIVVAVVPFFALMAVTPLVISAIKEHKAGGVKDGLE